MEAFVISPNLRLTCLAVVLCLAAAPARGEDCPAASTMMDDVLVALNEAATATAQ